MATHRPSQRLSSYGRLGLLLTGLGVLLAIDTLADLSFIYKLWPLLITSLGGGFLGIYVQRCRHEAVYIGVGTYLLGFSGLALYCNFTSWAQMADLWPLFVGFLGLSFCLAYLFGKRSRVLLLPGLLLISLTAVFFFVFAVSVHLWWTAFILAGLSFLIFDKTGKDR
jgi:hypothetical protein